MVLLFMLSLFLSVCRLERYTNKKQRPSISRRFAQWKKIRGVVNYNDFVVCNAGTTEAFAVCKGTP